jgi:hypothetical protein
MDGQDENNPFKNNKPWQIQTYTNIFSMREYKVDVPRLQTDQSH